MRDTERSFVRLKKAMRSHHANGQEGESRARACVLLVAVMSRSSGRLLMLPFFSFSCAEQLSKKNSVEHLSGNSRTIR